MGTPVNVSDTATGVDTIGTPNKMVPSSWTTPFSFTDGETCGFCNQPKTVVGNDGYYYVFYQSTDNNISYYHSPDGIAWTEAADIIGDGDILDGSQFVVWYDSASNLLSLIRTSSKDYTSFYWSVGTPNNGTITWAKFDVAQAVSYEGAMPQYPSVFFGLNHLYTGSLLWVSVTTTPDTVTYYNEVWQYDYSDVSPTWSNVKTDVITYPNESISIILGAHGNGSTILVRGGFDITSDPIIFYTTESDGVGPPWGGPYPTANTYALNMSGYTLGSQLTGYNDTIYISAIGKQGEGYGLYLIAFDSNDDNLFAETAIPTYPLGIGIGGGTTVSSDPYGLTIVCADNTAFSAINIIQSQPWGEFNPNVMTWLPLQTLFVSSMTFPSTPQIFFREVPGSPLSAVVAWEVGSPQGVMASVLYPAIPVTWPIGISDAVTGYDYISVNTGTIPIGISDSATASDWIGSIIIPVPIPVYDLVSALDWLGTISVPFRIDDSAIAIDYIGVTFAGKTVIVYDVAFGYDYIKAGIPITGLIDTAYAEDKISVQRFCTYNPISGAISLTPMDTDYIAISYRQQIDMIGIPITYRTQHIIGHGPYDHPIIEYTDSIVNAFITIFTNVEYEYVEEGFLPNHYANMWIYCTAPQVGDHVIWQGIEWEVRNSIPKVIGNKTVYYQTVLRRVLGNMPPATPEQNTLNSGGVASLPTGDP